MLMRKVLLFVLITFIGMKSWGQTTYTWNVASGDLDAAGSWSPARNTVAATDILVFDGNVQATATVTNIPLRETVGKISIINNCAVVFSTGTSTAGAGTVARSGTAVTGTGTAFQTDFIPGDVVTLLTTVSDIVSITSNTAMVTGSGTIAAGSAYTEFSRITVSGGSNSFTVAAGASLTISATTPISIYLPTGSKGSVSGNITFSGSSHRLNITDAGALTFNSGGIFTQGTSFNGSAFTLTTAVYNNVVFASGSTCIVGAGSNPFGVSQPNSKVTFNSGSLFKQTSGGPAFSGRTYANVEISTNASTSVSGSAAVTMNNLAITGSGTAFSFGMTGTPGHAINGNISVASGCTLNFATASAGTVNLSGSSAQTINGSGTITIGNNSTINISNSSGVTLSGTLGITGTGALTTNSNLTVATGGAITGVYANVTGTVTLQQSFVAQRGWRVLANPFTTATTIATVASNNGITIGTTAAASGLTDSRTLDNSTNTWTNVTGTTWAANTAYSLFYRGTTAEVTGNLYTSGPAGQTYSVSGTLNGASTSIPAPSSTSNFMLVGNPYAAPVSSSALTNGAGASYYVYQISVNGDGRTAAGGWSAQLSSSTSATIPVLGVIAYKPSASGYNIATTDINTGGTIQTGLFGAETVIKNLELVVNKDGVFQDKMFLRLDANSTEKGTDSKDLSKFYNDDVNFYTITKDNNRLAIDARKDFNSNIPLGINGTAGNYVLNVANNNLENVTIYLKDKLSNTQTELTPATNYNFSITADAATKGEGRFELQFVNKAIATLPTNNTSGGFTAKVLGNVITNNQPIQVQVQNASANAVIQVKDVNGRAIATQAAVNGLNTINVSRASLGLYIVQTTDGNNIVTDKVIKQ